MIFRLYARILVALRPQATTAVLVLVSSIAVSAAGLAEPILFGRLIDALGRGPGTAAPWLAAWAALGVAGIVAGGVTSLGADRMAHRLRLDLMTQAVDRAMTLPLARVSDRGTGRIVRTVSAGGDAVFWLVFNTLREQLPAVFALALLIPTAFWINPILAWVLVVLAAAYVVANVLVVRRTEAGQKAVEAGHQALSSRIGDVISNVAVLQAYADLRAETRQVAELARGVLAKQLPVTAWWAVLAMLTRSASALAMVAIFVVGAWLAARGRASLGEIVSFGGFAAFLIGRLDGLSGAVTHMFLGAPVTKAFFDLLDERCGPADAPDAQPLAVVRGRVTFRRVSYWHSPEGDAGVFDVDLDVEPGLTVALVGATGAGKTTLLSLLQRARDPDLGAIEIDGADLRGATLESVRRATAVVFQDSGLFNRSVADNLRLAKPDADDAELETVLRDAEAWEFVRGKPGGLEYVVGERGQLLSGGERQRLAIARAMLKDAPILILDEATSALDTVTEAKVKLALDRARDGRTTFVIAHRLSTVVDADLILVMDKGRIVERGRYEDLLRTSGRFVRMAAEAGLVAKPPTKPAAAAA